MSGSKVLLVSLPTSISPSNNKEEAFAALKSSITSDHGQVFQFSLPTFKIGTLDALVQQADELAKLSSACEGVVAKVAESLRSILEGDEDKIAEQKTVNDRQWLVYQCEHRDADADAVRSRRSLPAVFHMEQDQVSRRQANCRTLQHFEKGDEPPHDT